MSVTVPHQRWVKASTETDANVRQEIGVTARTLTVPSGVTAVRISFEKNAASAGGEQVIVRSYRHGTDPTSSIGKPHYHAEERDIVGLEEILSTKFISADGNTQIVYCQWQTVS